MARTSVWPLAILVGLLVGGASESLAAAERSRAGRPNVVVVVADDLGYGELGCYGGTEIPTPHLDAVAASGVRFTSGYVTAPFCAASRAGLLTGRYQTRFGFEFNPIGAKNALPGIGLPPAERTVADRLRAVGYATALVGKWHLGGTAPYHPHRRGFDEFFGFLHEGHTFVPPPFAGHVTWLRRTALPDGGQGRWTSSDGRTIWSTHMGTREPDYDADNPILRSSQPVDERANLTDAFTREACGFIDRHRAQPFFLYLAYNAVHSPMQAPDAYLRKFAHIPDVHRRIFAAMLAHLDDNIGQLVAKLRETDLERNTLVVFLSDNGGPTKELTSSNKPLRGGKGELWEGGLRVPFLLSWKGTIPAGQVVREPILSLDATATALELAGAPAEKLPSDGVNWLPFLQKKTDRAPRDTLYWRVGTKQAVRQGEWKLVRSPGPRSTPAEREWQLYHLGDDLAEATDLAPKHPDHVRRLSDLFDRWNTEQAEPLWRP